MGTLYNAILPEAREEIISTICNELMRGNTLKRACEQIPGMPDRDTVHRWIARDSELAARISRAREFGMDASVDECREIVDAATPENFNVARLQVWHRQWEASKRAPKVFGDKLQVDSKHSFTLELPASVAERFASSLGEMNDPKMIEGSV